jgi:hypothetical protein
MCSHTNYRAATVHDLVVPALGLTLTCTLRSCWTSLIDRLRSDADGTRPMAERCAVDVNASHDDTRSCSVGDNTLQSRESQSAPWFSLLAFTVFSVIFQRQQLSFIIVSPAPRRVRKLRADPTSACLNGMFDLREWSLEIRR